jgi:hypothetical protein
MTPTIKKLLAIVTAFKEIREASQASRERWQCCRLLEALDVRSVTGSRERRTAQEAKKPLQRCKEASQTSRERWQCCGLLEALDGSRGYNVSGKCKMAVAGEITVYTDHQNCYHKSLDQAASALVRAPTIKSLDQTASALVRAPRRVQL